MANQALWPSEYRLLSDKRLYQLYRKLEQPFIEALDAWQLPRHLVHQLPTVYLPLAAQIATRRAQQTGPLMLGINGAQGSGKSTLCQLLEWVLGRGFQLRVAGCSIDDFYLTRAQRQDLARQVHPLLVTRGVPGTHDVELGLELFRQLQNLRADGELLLPRFDKGRDDRRPQSDWTRLTGPLDVFIFEGWCVGAKPQEPWLIDKPVNRLEQTEDPDGHWRHFVNQRLAGAYQEWFGAIDFLLMLKVPSMACVFEWRLKQEERLKQQLLAEGHPLAELRLMDPSQIERFVMHYERLTRHILTELPRRADFCFHLDMQQRIEAISCQNRVISRQSSQGLE